jgi:hypothetical protein
MRNVTALFILLHFAALALATPYVPPEQITTHIGMTHYWPPETDATFNHMVEFVQIAAFEQPLQCEDPGANFGGEREEEMGGLYYVIETDNTLEAIEVWSRYYQLTGNSQYLDEIRDAWVYAYTWPAWLEGAGYYSSHNCAWALAAELKYRTTFNDSAHWDYAVNSANYILQTQLPLTDPLNVMVTGWCCGNLYLYGEATDNEDYKRVACQRALQIMDWVEVDPHNRLAMESWAMSSGTFIWGLCNSIFREDPALGEQWLAAYGPMVQVFEAALLGWSNAWNVAYTNAQGGLFDVTGDPIYASNHLGLTNYLLRQDMDNDGGIPSSAAGSQDADAAWTTSYLALMGCDRYLGSNIDAGVLMVTSPRSYTGIPQNIPLPITALLGNWSAQALMSVLVTVGGAYQDTEFVNLPAAANVRVDFGNWTPTVPGNDSLWVTVHAEGDTNEYNDADTSRFRVRPAGEDRAMAKTASPRPNGGSSLNLVASRGVCSFDLPQAGIVKMELYNLLGQKVQTIYDQALGAGHLDLKFGSETLPSGIYLLSLEAGGMRTRAKMVVMK